MIHLYTQFEHFLAIMLRMSITEVKPVFVRAAAHAAQLSATL